MLNGLNTLPRQSARFSGAVQIGLAGTASAPISTIGGVEAVRSSIENSLRLDGWNVVRVSVFGDQITAIVVGSTSDNLRTVANAFKNTVARRSFITLNNVVAEFTGTGAPIIQTYPTQQQPINTTGRQILLEFVFTPYSWFISESDLQTAMAQAFDRSGGAPIVNLRRINSDGSFLGATYRATFNAYASYANITNNQAASLVENALAQLGTVDSIKVVSIQAGTTTGSNTTKNNDDFSMDNLLSNFGKQLGFGAASALVGGAIVGAVALILILKKD